MNHELSSMPTTLNRYGQPSPLDQAPFGTHCKVIKQKEFEIYVQMSHNEEYPNWIIVGTFPKEISNIELINELQNFNNLKNAS